MISRGPFQPLQYGDSVITEYNSWLHAAPPKIQTLCLRAVSKCSLNSSSLGPWPGSMPTTPW